MGKVKLYYDNAIASNIALDKLVAIIADIKSDKEWVNDSHSEARYHGGVDAMERILQHIAELRQAEEVEYLESQAEYHYEVKHGK